MYNLFLDDYRNPKTSSFLSNKEIYITLDWVIVRNYDEFVSCITKNGLPDLCSFDHDLADSHYNNDVDINYDDYQEKTGYHCAKWLIDYCIDNNLKPPNYLVHSMNPAGANNIVGIIESYNRFLRR